MNKANTMRVSGGRPGGGKSLEQQAELAIRRQALSSGVTLTEEQVQRGVQQVAKQVAAQVRAAKGPSPAQQRRLKQIREGRLKGPVVSEEARLAAHGLHAPSELSVIAEPGETHD